MPLLYEIQIPLKNRNRTKYAILMREIKQKQLMKEEHIAHLTEIQFESN